MKPIKLDLGASTPLGNLLALAILAALVAALMYLTKGFREKESSTRRKEYYKRAALYFGGYIILTLLRYFTQGML